MSFTKIAKCSTLLQAKIYGRLAELTRQKATAGLKRRDHHADLASMGHTIETFIRNSEVTMEHYQEALQRLKEVEKKQALIPIVNRKYRVVHRLATFALDCVEYCRECQRKISLNAPSTLRQASSEPDLELVNNEGDRKEVFTSFTLILCSVKVYFVVIQAPSLDNF